MLSFAPDLTAIEPKNNPADLTAIEPKNNPAEHLLLLCYVARRFVTSIILASLLCRNQVGFNVRDG